MRIHFIGIGGIGVSALATYYLAKGHEVSGSDLRETEITQAMRARGAAVHIGIHRPENVPLDADMVIYSPAVSENNPELKQAFHIRSTRTESERWEFEESGEYHMQVLTYPQALGELTKEHYTIAVSGTHGKSTTTAMIALILDRAGFDPTVIVGTKLKEFDNTNCRVGNDGYFLKGKPILLIEADEHFASFLNYWPQAIVLTTIEQDHLDYYRNLGNILRTFKSYISHLPLDGVLVANKDDRNTQKLLVAGNKHPLTHYYSTKFMDAEKMRKTLKIPGEHNVANGLAALTLARALGIPDKTTYQALSAFEGTWRRFEIFKVSYPEEFTLVSDYGHHPTEIRVTLEAARSKWPKERLILIFQPHQYQRTYFFFRQFIRVLHRAPVDKLIIADIYDVPGREVPKVTEKVSAQKLVKEIQRQKKLNEKDMVLYLPGVDEIEAYLKTNLKGGEVVIVMGAGNIYDLVLRLSPPPPSQSQNTVAARLR